MVDSYRLVERQVLLSRNPMLCPEHEGTALLRHVCNYLPVYTALRPEYFNLYQPCCQHLRSSYVLQEWIAKKLINILIYKVNGLVRSFGNQLTFLIKKWCLPRGRNWAFDINITCWSLTPVSGPRDTNVMWIKNQLDVSFVFFISLLIVAQHVSGNHVPIIRSWRLRDVIASCW